MRHCYFSPKARQDVREIHDYIAGDSATAAARFTGFLIEKCKLLAGNQDLGERREDLAPSVRCFSARGYVFLYRPIDDGIEVVRIVHGARNIDALFGLDP